MAKHFSLNALASDYARHDAQDVIAISPSGQMRRADFLRRIDDWCHFFNELPGQRYALYLDDACELASALWGGWSAGKTICLPGDRLPTTLKKLSTQIDACIGEIPGAFPVPASGQCGKQFEHQVLDPKTCKLILYTSGSTGEPVAIEKKLHQLQSEVEALEQCFGDRLGHAVVFGTVSHQHIYGLLFRVLWPLMSGRVFYTRRLEYPEQIATQLATQNSVLIASPAHLKRLPEHLHWQAFSQHLQVVFSSGGPLSAESSDNVTQVWKHRPIEVFGSSETGGIAWRQAHDGSVAWQALPNVEWRHESGQLQIRSPHLPDMQWFATEDRIATRGDNSFELLGRSDRIIKLEERRISITAIEQSLQTSEFIEDCKLVLLPGQRERLAAVAVLSASGKQSHERNGKLSLVNQLRAQLESEVDAIAIPRHWRFVPALPMDSQGKTSQRQLAALFQMNLPPFHILQQQEDAAELALSMSRDLVVFVGHFSQDAAVVPGVALIDWAIKIARQLFSFKRTFLRIENLKFQQIIQPDALVTLSLQWNAEKGVLQFRYQADAAVHGSGRIVFSPREEIK